MLIYQDSSQLIIMDALVDTASLNVQVSPSSSGLTLTWREVAAASYNIVCSSKVNVDCLANYTEIHSMHHVLCDSTATSVLLRNLVPGLAYNCCVSAVALADTVNETAADCILSTVPDGLSAPVIGAIGGTVGAFITALIILTIGGIIICSVMRRTRR